MSAPGTICKVCKKRDVLVLYYSQLPRSMCIICSIEEFYGRSTLTTLEERNQMKETP
ncbi:MAG: hypothetical protein JRD89_15560 [Deltaproteobacteria bacterium]|nr:hypothetical protein [Deltaproteobacteria bacterium]